MTRERDHWFKFKSAKWRDGTRGLSPGAKGMYTDLISLMHETADAGYVDDAHKIALHLGYRDYRTVAAPLAELKAERKLIVWRGRLFNATVCRDRHALAVKRKQRSPVPAEVWAIIEADEKSPEPVDDHGDKGGSAPQVVPETRRCSADDRPMIGNSGCQAVDIPRNTLSHTESDTEEVVADSTGIRARARAGPETRSTCRSTWARAGPLRASA